MRKNFTLILAILLCVAATVFVSSCGGTKEDTTDNANIEAADSTETTSPAVEAPTDAEAYNAKNSIESMEKLEEYAKSYSAATDAAGLNSLLNGSTTYGAVLLNAEKGQATVEGGFTDKTVVVKSADSTVVSKADGMSYIIEEISDGGLIAENRAGSVYVKGENVSLTLKNGADAVYISGKNCDAVFKGGEFSVVYVNNITAKLTNLTDNDITVTLANSSRITLPSGQVYSLEDNSFSKAK